MLFPFNTAARRVMLGAVMLSIAWAAPAMASDDARLQGRIEAALILSESLNEYVFTVQVSDGQIVIDGAVSAETDQRLVYQVVRSVVGDEGIDNQVELAPAQSDTGAMVTQRDMLRDWHSAQWEAELRREFNESAAVDGQRIDIEIDDDTLILTGTVRSELERMVANQLGQNLARIQVVNNRLTVEE